MANFPKSHKIGAEAEDKVGQLFLSWGWNHGRDRIDMGYDLFVTPDETVYKGARFLVQVKGTSRSEKSGSILAPVDRERLRQYARNMLPVFIVRVSDSGVLYWIHAQEWAKVNYDQLNGKGKCRVRMVDSNQLSDRAAFESYLADAFLASPNHGKPLPNDTSHLNAIGPNFGQAPHSRQKDTRVLELDKRTSLVGEMTFNTPDKEGLANLRDAISYGLPRSIEVSNFKMNTSPALGRHGKGLGKGTLTISRAPDKVGTVRLFPGKIVTVSSLDVPIDVELYSGMNGVAISSENRTGLLDILVKVSIDTQADFSASVSVRKSVYCDRPMRDVDSLRPMAEWAEQAMVHKSIVMEIAFGRDRAAGRLARDEINALWPILDWVKILSRLHLVAKQLNSDISLTVDSFLSEEECNDINLTYLLLKGERPSLVFNDFYIDGVDIEIDSKSILYCTPILSIEIQGQHLGDIPVKMEFSGCEINKTEDGRRILVKKGAASEAWISYYENDGGAEVAH